MNRRCTKCGYDESPTANTLFHKLKFGIENAFEMAYDIATSKKGANSVWLAERYGVKQMTAWLFRRKRVFTEQGVAMLSSVLSSETGISVNNSNHSGFH